MENTLNVSQVWNETLKTLADDDSMSPQQRAFVALTVPQFIDGETISIAAPNEFTRNVLESHLKPHVVDALQRVLNRPMTVHVTVDPNIAHDLDDETTDSLADGTYASEDEVPTRVGLIGNSPNPHEHVVDVRDTHRPGAGSPVSRNDDSHRLNPKYVFETFVIGSSNRFAHAAAVAVAEAPAKAYNPLFIYGESGLGKTHLLHAIGHYTRTLFAGAKVRYVSSEEFTNEFINSIRDDKAANFQRRYRDIDVLLVDDIQFLSGKVQTQEEFFHTFNTLHNANKQIVVTSDLPPKQLPDFEERMRSRFEWGLITDVQPPDLETRIAILRKKTAQERIAVEPEVLEFIASKIATNIRELEGALIRVTAFASLNGSPVDVSLAELVLKDLIADQHGPQVTAPLIMQQSAEYYGVTMNDLCGPSRARSLVQARQVAMYLCRELTELSLPNIGKHFGGRDHTTVMHAKQKIHQNL
ncbi:MAG TPA: chromosomal replication initiator protein DnaA, partial [Actinobacteria bacterium]|nr:chromosomal replication initiator protein DnaA [Actinomycetota bacterium]